MSYAQRKEMASNRTVSIVIVALIHLVLGYAIVTGLAHNIVKKAAEDLKTFDVEEEPPPPEEEPPPPEEIPDVPPPPMTPPPMVRLDTPPPPIQLQQREITQPPPPMPPPAPPPPPAPRQAEPKSLSGSLQGLIRSDDYPQSAIENEEQGTVGVALQVGPNGRVSGCSVTSSSGSRTLDNATCSILTRRARFSPAQDSNGNAITATHRQRITWRLE
jgi:periplasmic protein TonB